MADAPGVEKTGTPTVRPPVIAPGPASADTTTKPAAPKPAADIPAKPYTAPEANTWRDALKLLGIKIVNDDVNKDGQINDADLDKQFEKDGINVTVADGLKWDEVQALAKKYGVTITRVAFNFISVGGAAGSVNTATGGASGDELVTKEDIQKFLKDVIGKIAVGDEDAVKLAISRYVSAEKMKLVDEAQAVKMFSDKYITTGNTISYQNLKLHASDKLKAVVDAVLTKVIGRTLQDTDEITKEQLGKLFVTLSFLGQIDSPEKVFSPASGIPKINKEGAQNFLAWFTGGTKDPVKAEEKTADGASAAGVAKIKHQFTKFKDEYFNIVKDTDTGEAKSLTLKDPDKRGAAQSALSDLFDECLQFVASAADENDRETASQYMQLLYGLVQNINQGEKSAIQAKLLVKTQAKWETNKDNTELGKFMLIALSGQYQDIQIALKSAADAIKAPLWIKQKEIGQKIAELGKSLIEAYGKKETAAGTDASKLADIGSKKQIIFDSAKQILLSLIESEAVDTKTVEEIKQKLKELSHLASKDNKKKLILDLYVSATRLKEPKDGEAVSREKLSKAIMLLALAIDTFEVGKEEITIETDQKVPSDVKKAKPAKKGKRGKVPAKDAEAEAPKGPIQKTITKDEVKTAKKDAELLVQLLDKGKKEKKAAPKIKGGKGTPKTAAKEGLKVENKQQAMNLAIARSKTIIDRAAAEIKEYEGNSSKKGKFKRQIISALSSLSSEDKKKAIIAIKAYMTKKGVSAILASWVPNS
ncbi:hypothetical protein HZC34_06965 [Candidatus Saganbacteria bacterium]|nr:hypothetical protein [Candidatus Saganbacteria bacterium]